MNGAKLIETKTQIMKKKKKGQKILINYGLKRLAVKAGVWGKTCGSESA